MSAFNADTIKYGAKLKSKGKTEQTVQNTGSI